MGEGRVDGLTFKLKASSDAATCKVATWYRHKYKCKIWVLTFDIVINISMKCTYDIYLKIWLFVGVGYYSLYGCFVLIVISLLIYYRLYECSVLIVISLLINYNLCGCSVVISFLVSYRFCRYSVVISLLVNCRLRRCNVVISSLVNYRFVGAVL